MNTIRPLMDENRAIISKDKAPKSELNKAFNSVFTVDDKCT